MGDILNVGSFPVRDTTIVKKQFLTYSPYTSSFEHNDEIRIAIQSQDLYVLPSESYLTFEVKVSRKEGDNHALTAGTWSKCFATQFFSDIRYELNNVEVDRAKNPSMTSNLKTLMAFPHGCHRVHRQLAYYEYKALIDKTYSFIIPLNNIFGFCDDYI